VKYNSPYSTAAWGSQAKDWEQGIDYSRLSKERLARTQEAIKFAGLGGVLTPTGVGTVVEEGKTKLAFDGVEYLVERALRADLAILRAHRADEKGNLVYQRAARNFNPLMAFAGDFVVAEVDEIVAPGQLDPELVVTPGILVDALILAGER
jgi:acetate CoA/acetoacetate CoA-transferase alpha subunit